MRSMLRRVLMGMLLVSLLVVWSASPATAGGWARDARIDPGRPAGLACPSSTLCVAVDSSGNALISTAAGMAAKDWRVAPVDLGGSLTGVSCPSAGLCVAVDTAGRVLTSQDPAGLVWQSGMVGSEGWAAVSCPTVSLCVAVGGQDVAFSVDPMAGSSSWTVVHGVDRGVDYECAKYNPSGPCSPYALTSVSCPTRTLCEAIDGGGGGVVSTDPGSTNGWPPIQGLEANHGGSNTVACASGVLCLQDCAVGVGVSACSDAQGSYDSGQVIAADPTGRTPARAKTISDSPLIGLWCTPWGCFAAPQSAGLLASNDPGAAHAWWQQLIASSPAHPNPATTIATAACPSRRLCIALAGDGTLLTGPPPATIAQLHRALRATLNHPPPILRASTLLRSGGYDQHCGIPAPGTLTISWYQTSTHTLVARAQRTFRSSTVASIKITLTRQGRQILAAGPIRLATRGTFAPDGTSTIHQTGPLLHTRSS